MKKLLSLVGMVVVLSGISVGFAAEEGEWTGWIADEACAKDYNKVATPNHANCARTCLTNGGRWALGTPNGHYLLTIDAALAGEHLGHEVTIKGQMDGNTITVASVSASPHSH